MPSRADAILFSFGFQLNTGTNKIISHYVLDAATNRQGAVLTPQEIVDRLDGIIDADANLIQGWISTVDPLVP